MVTMPFLGPPYLNLVSDLIQGDQERTDETKQ